MSVVLDTDFGLGEAFLASWQAWRDEPSGKGRLFVVALCPQPPDAATLARAHAGTAHAALASALARAWPPLTPDLHVIELDAGQVQLLLAVSNPLGDSWRQLSRLRLQADTILLRGGAWPSRWLKALGRHAAPGARLLADTGVTGDAAGAHLRADLLAAGFQPESGAGPGLRAVYAPRHAPRGGAGPAPRHAVVVGAGLAGAAVAHALVGAGVSVTVIDRQPTPAAETSGNPAGLFHGTVNGDDGTYARLFRAAALHATDCYRAALAQGQGDGQGPGQGQRQGQVAGNASGLLRLHPGSEGTVTLQALLHRQHLPASYVRAVDAEAASALAGVPLSAPAWHYPGGGWLSPADWVRHALQAPGIRFCGGLAVNAIQRAGDDWQVLDAAGQVLAAAPLLVLCNAAGAMRLLAPLGHAPWPLCHTRGQVTHIPGPTPLKLPVAGDGYALPLPNGLLCGATREPGEPDRDQAPMCTEAEHRSNLQGLQRLTGLQGPADPALWQGRAGWRLHSDDRLPIAGALPLARMPAGQRQDQVRLLPREAGLFVLTALGARGLTLAPLLGRLVAAQALGHPWPLPQDLADAVDPGRWAVRAARKSTQPVL